MDRKEIKETPVWLLYEKGRNFHRQMGVYTDTDRNYRFYNGNQWEGANLADIEPVQKNFIRPIVKYKTSVIHSNLYALHFSSQNYENPIFQRESERYCKILNGYVSRIWEKDKMDKKGRQITKDAAINGEGILYVTYDKEKQMPLNEVVDKTDVYYGNENTEDIQSQPYILIRRRMPVVNAIELALSEGMDESNSNNIIGDNDTFEQSGDASKYEVDNAVTVIYKLYKEKGTVHYSIATKWQTIVEGEDTGLSLYPVAHFTWEEKKGSARGEGEVRCLIPNQIEVNKNEVRRVLAVKHQAFPKTMYNSSLITNPEDLNRVGVAIEVNGVIDDIRKAIGTLPPAQMSSDVKQLHDDLIQITRDLAGAGEVATGSVNPETASGKAILAVQRASQAPVNEQKEGYKSFLEDVGNIWMEYLMVHSEDGIKMPEKIVDRQGKETYQIVVIPQSALKKLQASVNIDVTPKSVFDKLAQEQTIEALLMGGFLTPQRVNELKAYAEVLDDDSTAPKIKILELVDKVYQTQQQIAKINSEAQMMMQRAEHFLTSDIDSQAQQIADAKMKLAQTR